MGSCFRFKASRAHLSASDIASLRSFCTLSISEIRQRAERKQSLLDVQVFQGDWPLNKSKIVAVLHAIEQGTCPISVYYVDFLNTDSESEEELSLEQSRDRLQFLREISLEQDMLSQLELGYINAPEEYVPRSEDEA